MREVYARAGESLNIWSQVEDLVMAIFMSFISSRRPDAIRDAYMQIIAFEAKLSATDAAAKVALANSPAHMDRWIAIRKRLDSKRKIRNKIAHSQTLYNDTKKSARLFPFYSVIDPNLDWNSGWQAKTLYDFGVEFVSLHSDLANLLSSMRDDLDMWPTDWRPTP
jgi:hypothetical protein